MSTLKKIQQPTDIYKMRFPRVPPYTCVGEYLTSKNYLRSAQFRNCELDTPGWSPYLFLLAARTCFDTMNMKLAARREREKKERVKLEEQWASLYEDEKKLQETFKAMANFIKTNDDKRQRARNALASDQETVKKWEQENARLKESVNNVIDLTKEKENAIAARTIYEKYLNSVVSFSDKEFKNADEIVSRYEALLSTKTLLAKRQDDTLQLLESARAKTGRMIEDYKFKIMGLSNKVADLNSRYNTAFRKAVHWENIVLAIRRNCYEKFQEMTEVKQSCWNLYLLMCQRKGETPKLNEDNLELLLLYVKKTLQELELIKKVIVSRSSGGHSDHLLPRKNSRSKKHPS